MGSHVRARAGSSGESCRPDLTTGRAPGLVGGWSPDRRAQIAFRKVVARECISCDGPNAGAFRYSGVRVERLRGRRRGRCAGSPPVGAAPAGVAASGRASAAFVGRAIPPGKHRAITIPTCTGTGQDSFIGGTGVGINGTASINHAAGLAAVVAGGFGNDACGAGTSILAGTYSGIDSTSTDATIAGGNNNALTGSQDGSIGGGYQNLVNADYGAIAGGAQNTAGPIDAIGGGSLNSITGQDGTIAGGAQTP